MKYRYSLISFISFSLYFLSPLFNIFLHCSNVITYHLICRVLKNNTYFLPHSLGLEGFSPPLFLRFRNLYVQCKDIKNISKIQIFLKLFFDETLTFAYGVDARMRDFADIAEAEPLTQ